MVQSFVESMRKVGGIINTAIVMAAARGIMSARNPAIFIEHGGHIEFTKAWAKPLLKQMGYVKRKCSHAGKLSVARFEELKNELLADVKAGVLMNATPKKKDFQLGSHRASVYAYRAVDNAPCKGKSYLNRKFT